MKKKIFTAIVLLLLAGFVIAVFGAGSITQTYPRPSDTPQWTMRKITLDWTSDVNGDVTGTDTSVPIDGLIYRVVTIPDSALTTAPTDSYDIVLYDDDDIDVLLGLGVDEPNAATATSNQFCPYLDRDNGTTYTGPVAVRGVLELQVSNAGDEKGGKVIIYWR